MLSDVQLRKCAQVVKYAELGGFSFLRATSMNFVSGFLPIGGLGGRQILGLREDCALRR